LERSAIVPLSLSDAVRLTSAIVGIAVMLSSAELLVERRRLENNDLLGWDVGRYYTRFTIGGWLGPLTDILFAARGFKVLTFLRFLTGLAMLSQSVVSEVSAWILAAGFILTFLMAVRSPFGLDGAFQMNLVTLAGLWVHAVSPAGSIAAAAGLWFITVQLGLSYAIAGVSKLPSKIWRNGVAITGILGTSIYGHQGLHRIVSKARLLAFVASWAVMTFELSFLPLCLLGGKAALAAMVIGVAFHLSNAAFMGLNGFLISFVAAYPIAWSLLSDGLLGVPAAAVVRLGDHLKL
jgi:hypothetical protein